MAERLTEKVFDNNGKQQDIYEWSSASSLECNKKLGMLEDIMEKYNIDSVEELEELLDDNKYAQNVIVKQLVELKNAKTDRDTWKRACEFLAYKYAEEYFDGRDIEHCFNANKRDKFVKENINYFYQQAKKEGNDE